MIFKIYQKKEEKNKVFLCPSSQWGHHLYLLKEEKKKYPFNLTEKDQNGENILAKFIEHRTSVFLKYRVNRSTIIRFVLYKSRSQ